MSDIILVYRTTPPYVPGDYLPPVVSDGRGRKHVFQRRAFVDAVASRKTEDGRTEYLLHVTETHDAR